MILHSIRYCALSCGLYGKTEGRQCGDGIESSGHSAVSSVPHKYRTAPVWLPCGDRSVAVP